MIQRICPRCQVDLEWTEYEGQRVMRCPGCAGHLVAAPKLRAIQRTDRLGASDLMEEAQREFKGPRHELAACPACKARMNPEALNVPGMNLTMDVCRSCQVVWLDGGELALLQLAYQQTPEYQALDEMRRRARELEADPDRKAQFHEDFAKLRDEPGLMEHLADGLAEHGLTHSHRRFGWLSLIRMLR